MKILHIIPGLTYEAGGPPAALQGLVKHQAGAGHEVVVLTTDQGVRRGGHPVGLCGSVTVERGTVWGPDRTAYAPGFASLIRKYARACDIAHVHSVFTYPVHVALCGEKAVADVPVVVQPHGVLHRYSLQRSRLRKRAYLAAWGKAIRRTCTAWHYTSANEEAESWPWDSSRRFVVPYGIEAADYAVDRGEAREVVRRLWPQLGDSPYVLFLGRLDPKKRPDLLVEAFATAAPPGVKLVVAGPDAFGLWRRRIAGRLRVSPAAGQVARLGTVTGRAKVALLAGATLFALPSEHENFGIAPLEALAAGTPVLLSPRVDLADAAVAAGVGYTEPLEVEAWRARLAALLADPDGLSAAAERRRQWARDHYAWARIGRELVQHYSRVIGSRPGG